MLLRANIDSGQEMASQLSLGRSLSKEDFKSDQVTFEVFSIRLSQFR